MDWYADLHCHTSFSDGSLCAEEVVCLAAERGVRVLAVTDHDSIEGWMPAWERAREVSLTLIPGVEINTAWMGREIHILGYFDPRFAEGCRDENIKELDRVLERLRGKRIHRAQAIVGKLKGLGVDIAWNQVERLRTGPSVGRAHVARVLVEQGVVMSVEEAFVRYLSVGAAAYVPNEALQPSEAIESIVKCGGVAVLAHPKELEATVWGAWMASGLAGVEVWHPDHSLPQTEALEKATQRLELLATGGSDFHGFGLHGELGSCGVDKERAERLLLKLAESYEKIRRADNPKTILEKN